MSSNQKRDNLSKAFPPRSVCVCAHFHKSITLSSKGNEREKKPSVDWNRTRSCSVPKYGKVRRFRCRKGGAQKPSGAQISRQRRSASGARTKKLDTGIIHWKIHRRFFCSGPQYWHRTLKKWRECATGMVGQLFLAGVARNLNLFLKLMKTGFEASLALATLAFV